MLKKIIIKQKNPKNKTQETRQWNQENTKIKLMDFTQDLNLDT